jgi:peptidoglycan/LPS O-acetylase OafA/YrhL
METPRSDRLPALTGLRFLAALAILLFHYGGPLVAALPPWVDRVRTSGYAWVGLFYVLSGFVLARAHPEPMDAQVRRRFWIARLARLYPAYLVAFLLAAPFVVERSTGGPAAAAKGAIVAAASLLLVQAWVPPIARIWNAPGWSTSVVASFYLAFPFAAARLARLSRRGLWVALAGAWALSLSLPLLYLALRPDGPVAHVAWNEPFWLEALKFHPLARAGEFLAGVALGLLDRRAPLLRRGGGIAAALAFAAAFALLAWGGVPYPSLHNGALVPLFAVGLVGVARSAGPVARALASAPARVLGDASFALYALQEPLWLWARRLAGEPGPRASAGFVLAFSAAAIAISVCVSSGLERPARRGLRALLGGDCGRRDPSTSSGKPQPGESAAPGTLLVPSPPRSGGEG